RVATRAALDPRLRKVAEHHLRGRAGRNAAVARMVGRTNRAPQLAPVCTAATADHAAPVPDAILPLVWPTLDFAPRRLCRSRLPRVHDLPLSLEARALAECPDGNHPQHWHRKSRAIRRIRPRASTGHPRVA